MQWFLTFLEAPNPYWTYRTLTEPLKFDKKKLIFVIQEKKMQQNLRLYLERTQKMSKNIESNKICTHNEVPK